jgi:hypothetical protein
MELKSTKNTDAVDRGMWELGINQKKTKDGRKSPRTGLETLCCLFDDATQHSSC